MFKLFVEYRIEESARESFLEWIGPKLTGQTQMQIYEGTDQPGLFVEVWEAENEAKAKEIKEERCGERSSSWIEMALWVKGGSSKVHAWIFKPVSAF